MSAKVSKVSVMIDAATHKHIDVPVSNVTIKINDDGSAYTLADLLNDFSKQVNRINTLEEKHYALAAKYNSLKAAYSLSSAVMAAQIADTKNN